MREIRKLKWRIALVFSVLTGAVLLVVCVLACRMALLQREDTFDSLLETQFETMAAQVSNGRSVNVLDIYHYEKENGVYVAFYDNGQSVSAALPLRDTRREQVLAAAEGWFLGGGAPEDTAGGARLSAAGEDWRGIYRLAPSATGHWYGVLLLKSESSLAAGRRDTVLYYLLIFAGGLACVFGICVLLASAAVKPALRAGRQQMEFATAAGHDLRTPLAVIKSSAQLLQRGGGDAARQAGTIVAESDRMARLVEDLLLISAGEAGRLSVEPGRVDLEALLIGVYESFEPVAAKAGFTLALHFPDRSLPAAYGDAGRITQIVGTLLNNAVEYGGPGGEIELVPRAHRRFVELAVVDHGPGVPDEQKQRVFSQFYRADASRSGKEHFGLGLSVARRLAEAQGASLRLEDTPGGGASFVLRLERFSR